MLLYRSDTRWSRTTLNGETFRRFQCEMVGLTISIDLLNDGNDIRRYGSSWTLITNRQIPSHARCRVADVTQKLIECTRGMRHVHGRANNTRIRSVTLPAADYVVIRCFPKIDRGRIYDVFAARCCKICCAQQRREELGGADISQQL